MEERPLQGELDALDAAVSPGMSPSDARPRRQAKARARRTPSPAPRVGPGAHESVRRKKIIDGGGHVIDDDAIARDDRHPDLDRVRVHAGAAKQDDGQRARRRPDGVGGKRQKLQIRRPRYPGAHGRRQTRPIPRRRHPVPGRRVRAERPRRHHAVHRPRDAPLHTQTCLETISARMTGRGIASEIVDAPEDFVEPETVRPVVAGLGDLRLATRIKDEQQDRCGSRPNPFSRPTKISARALRTTGAV